MFDSHQFLPALAMVLCVAAVTTVLFQRLKQPVVLGYLLAGLIIGPHVPVPLVADAGIVHTLSELGVILLMFSLGLEFSLRKLLSLGAGPAFTALLQCSVMIWLGFVVGRLFGWTQTEALFAGAIIAISSTTIIAKAFDEQGIKGKLRGFVVGVLIVEDLIAVVLMATVSAMAKGSGLTAGELLWTFGRLAAFLVGLVVAGLWLVPRAVRAVVKLDRPETTLVASVGFCFAIAFLAQSAGYSVALGAFIAGSLIAESGEQHTIEHLVQPVRDMFAAVFFVSVGMMLDPKLVAEHWAAILVLCVVVVVGKVLGVTLGAFLTGNGVRTSVQAGMSLAQIGEFSFIIAGLGLSLKATGSFLYPVAVAVSAFTTLTTPWLIQASGPAASFVDRKLPRRLQTFASLYGSWLEQLKIAPRQATALSRLRRLSWLLFLDAALLAGVVITASLFSDAFRQELTGWTGLSPSVVRALAMGVTFAVALPFALGIVRLAQALGGALGEVAIPKSVGKLDLGAAPRKALVVALQMALVLLVGVPFLALTQPFLPGIPGAGVLLALMAVLGFTFWRSAAELHGHVRAGAEVIAEALSAQSREPAAPKVDPFETVRGALLGMGEPAPLTLNAASPAVGKTLAELNVRGLTGATVLAVTRQDGAVTIPTAHEVLREGDRLALAGTREAVEAAQRLLGAQT